MTQCVLALQGTRPVGETRSEGGYSLNMEKVVVNCPNPDCQKRLRFSKTRKTIRVRCPWCKSEFRYKFPSIINGSLWRPEEKGRNMSKMTTEKRSTNTLQNSLVFIKELAKYFMDFLETDFHKRRNPKRSVQFRNKDNLRVGINLSKYNNFNNLVFKLIPQVFSKSIQLKKGKYRTNVPKNLLDIIF